MTEPHAVGQPRRFFVVPHTHWDREWYRPFEHFRLELARVVDGVIDVLERDPSFASFTLDGQAIVLEDYLEVRPENEGRLRALLGAGRIEVGPSYVLPDEFLVGAEPLVRNLLIGRAVCERFGGEPSPAGYLPDSFGHPQQLPQLLAGFGIESFIFSRGLGDQLDSLGAAFRWRAPDGSEVLAFQQLPDYANFAAVSDVEDAAGRVRDIVERFETALALAGISDVLLCNGSDHLPVMPGMPRLCSELEQRFPGSRFTIAKYADYARAVGRLQAGVWSGELVGSRLQNVLRGVNSARLYIKRANERAERRLLAVEALAAIRSLHDGTPFPGSDFKLAWRELLRCHPHDTICGCSCDEVHRDALGRYESLQRTLSVLERRAIEGLGTAAPDAAAVGIVNPLPYRRRGLVELPGAAPAVVELDGFGARTVEIAPPPPRPDARTAASERGRESEGDRTCAAIESDRFRIEATSDGTLALLDKAGGRRFEGLHGLEDEPDMGDLYNFCPVEDAPTWRSERAAVRVLADGPLVSEVEVRVQTERPAGLDAGYRPLRETLPLTVSTVVRLVQGSRRVEFRTTIENAARDHRLRVVFPVGAARGPVRAEGQFALVRRPLAPPRPQTEWVEPPDATQHTLGAVAIGPIALIAKGLPEYEARADGERAELCLTLLRCVGVISRASGVLATRPRTAGPQVSTPDAECVGRHECEYALVPDGDSLGDVELLRESQDYRCGFLTVEGGVQLDSPLAIEGDVVFSCLKGAEDGDGLILRCFNPSSSPVSARVVGDVAVSRTRLDETGEQSMPEGVVALRAGQIATLRLRRG
jgi:2-O-(6-phospho-alpha-D-mannosyl)-D-glycerate hydrolase